MSASSCEDGDDCFWMWLDWLLSRLVVVVEEEEEEDDFSC